MRRTGEPVRRARPAGDASSAGGVGARPGDRPKNERQKASGAAGAPAQRMARAVAVALALYAMAVPLALSVLLATSEIPPLSPLLSTLWLAMAILGPAGAVV